MMKINLLKICVFVLLLASMLAGCNKENKGDDNLMVKAFPVLYTGYNLLYQETAIIRDQEAFDKVYTKEIVTQFAELQHIDFSKYDVLAGDNSYIQGIDKLEHKFIKTGNQSYLYNLDVFYNDALPAGRFCYGIIVKKLSLEATVKFEVTKIY